MAQPLLSNDIAMGASVPVPGRINLPRIRRGATSDEVLLQKVQMSLAGAGGFSLPAAVGRPVGRHTE